MSGKGSKPRPYSVDTKTFDNNWDLIFNKGNVMGEQKTGTCGCGRSPTGDCVGWHNLTVEQYQSKLQEQTLKEQKQLLNE
jgi:hypothetical protein